MVMYNLLELFNIKYNPTSIKMKNLISIPKKYKQLNMPYGTKLFNNEYNELSPLRIKMVCRNNLNYSEQIIH